MAVEVRPTTDPYFFKWTYELKQFDVVIAGAGAAGMMCAIEAGKRGRSVLVIDHAKAPGEKIRISGGGRCNFTNSRTAPENFLSGNPRFCISALRRYTQNDFIALVRQHRIPYHEKTLGQLFCDESSRHIIDMLVTEMAKAGAELRLQTEISTVEKTEDGFVLHTSTGPVACGSFVVATGGKSVPKMGATGFGYKIAEQFDMCVTETRPGLVPLTFDQQALQRIKPLSGIAVDASVAHGKTRFDEALLFTHRGLSGPAILQISSFWREGDEIVISLAPGADIFEALKAARATAGKQAPQTVLAHYLPKRLAQDIAEHVKHGGVLAQCNDKQFRDLEAAVNAWRIKPAGSEGYRTAEVTLGGVDTGGLDSKTMQAKSVPGLYFIGEVVDVTGWLGGYNFQWAWSSGWCAGRYV